MTKLHLKYDLLRGDFTPGPRNFLFTFQVNCPGCFFYGLPVVNALHHEFKNEISFLGLSTAFEDFELNTRANTEALLNSGTIVGETQKALTQRGYETYPEPIDFPVGMDVEAGLNTPEAIDTICNLNPNFQIWPPFEQEAMRGKVREYLTQSEHLHYTFTLNQFKGTPSFVLFDDQMRVHEQWFGHREPEAISALLRTWISA